MWTFFIRSFINNWGLFKNHPGCTKYSFCDNYTNQNTILQIIHTNETQTSWNAFLCLFKAAYLVGIPLDWHQTVFAVRSEDGVDVSHSHQWQKWPLRVNSERSFLPLVPFLFIFTILSWSQFLSILPFLLFLPFFNSYILAISHSCILAFL